MRMCDMSYCGTFCDQKNCARNLRYNKPVDKYYSASNFDEEDNDPAHRNCKYKILKRELRL